MLGNIILCLRFPFLWTRNRFTGRHYNNWDLLDWIKDRKSKSMLWVHLGFTKKEKPGPLVLELTNKKSLSLEVYGKEIWVVLRWKSGLERVVTKLVSPVEILGVSWGQKGVINVWVKEEPSEPRFIYGSVVYSWWKWVSSKIVEWIHNYPLQILHCLPDHTELDGLEKGWRKAFGIELCRDIRKALWKEGGLRAIFRFRITQIKEKYGYLHFYCDGGGKEVLGVISKYEDISSKTCIVCGKPAKWISRGWISPYCDDCISDKDYADPIDKKEEGI